jgi:hypothetical protein
MKTLFVSSSIVLVAMLAHSPLKAQPNVNGQTSQSSSTKTAEAPIYGSQLMTDRERQEYRDKIQAAKTDAEREGITLPDEPPVARRVGPPPGSSGVGPGPKPSGPNPPGPKSPGPNPGQGKGRP